MVQPMGIIRQCIKSNSRNKFVGKLVACCFALFLVLSNLSSNNLYADSHDNNNGGTEQSDETGDTEKSDDKRLWNLDDVDILALIGEMSRITKRNFIIDPRVSGKASLISNEPMTNEEAYKAFLSILQVLGFSTVESGAVTKIVPSSVAKQFDTKFDVKELADHGDEMLVQVIPVQHVAATALIPILRNLVNQQGHIAPYAPSNVIVIADHASNVKRIKEIIHRIDQENTDDIEIIPLKDAMADEVVKVLTALMAKNQALGEPASHQVKLASDIRTNSILLGGDKEKRLKVRAIIAQLDIPTPNAGDTIVHYLKYQSAGDLVPILASVVEAYYNKKAGGDVATTSRASAGGPSRASTVSSSSGSTDGSITSNFELQNVRRGEEGMMSAPGIIAEPNMNALVITAPPELMRSIMSVITKLDIRRYQIYVEALIVEVSLQHHLDFGVEWRLPGQGRGWRGGTNLGDPNTVDSATGIINGANAPVEAGTAFTDSSFPSALLRNLTLPGALVGFIQGGDIRAIIHTLEQDVNTNILSTPSLVTMDNETAEILVAEQIPFQTGNITNTASATATTSGNLTNTFDYRDVGLKLKITPSITKGSKGEAIKMAIDQETGNVREPGDRPITAKRSIKTIVTVDDGDILVLGGLIQGQTDAGESKIPILGDLPFVGKFFKRQADALSKRTLMVFIRPVVMRNREESNNISLSKYDLMRDSQLLYKVDPYGKLAKEIMPELPDLNKKFPHDKQRLNLPSPFVSNTFIDDILDHKLLNK